LLAAVVVYSARGEDLIKPVFDAFTKETGVKVEYITDTEAALVQRLKGEAERTKADLLITVDAGNLWQAAHEGVLQPVDSATLTENVPAHLRDPGQQWFGLSVRARTVAYSTKRVKPEEISSLASYDGLADAKWKGRLCLRTSKKVYNQSLVAMLVAQHGEVKAQTIVDGWVANLATEVFPNDTDLLKAIDAGQCDVGLVNTYYFGRLKRDKPELAVALAFPNAGVHVNVSGAGVTKYAPHKKDAVRLLEWMSGPAAQKIFADVNLEYPANPKVDPDAAVKAWGTFKQDVINVSKAGELQSVAIKVMDRAKYR